MISLLLATALAADFELRGVDRLSEDEVRAVVGEVPDVVDADWAEAALTRVLVRYRAEGYVAARGWVDLDGGLAIEIDEGKVHRVALVGGSAYRRLLLSDNLDLDEGVLHGPTLERSLARIQERSGVRAASWDLRESKEFAPTPTGRLASERVLRVLLATEEARGFDLDLSVDPIWGFLAGGTFDAGDLAGTGDHVSTGVRVAFPLQEYVFEQEPQLRWVHGEMHVGYRTPWLTKTELAPEVHGNLALSNYSRPYDGLLEAGVLYGALRPSVSLGLPGLTRLRVGPVFEGAQVAFTRLDEGALPLDERTGVTRYGLFTVAELAVPDEQTLRIDLRDALSLDLTAFLTSAGIGQLRATLEGQVVGHVGRTLVLARGRALHRGGDVRFYDEEPLAGRYHRVFFEGRWWVRQAAQLELGVRYPVSRDVHLGVFHDLSVFGDRLQTPTAVAVANGAGPGLHVLIADMFAADIFYAVGTSPAGWSHNMSLGLTSAY